MSQADTQTKADMSAPQAEVKRQEDEPALSRLKQVQEKLGDINKEVFELSVLVCQIEFRRAFPRLGQTIGNDSKWKPFIDSLHIWHTLCGMHVKHYDKIKTMTDEQLLAFFDTHYPEKKQAGASPSTSKSNEYAGEDDMKK